MSISSYPHTKSALSTNVTEIANTNRELGGIVAMTTGENELAEALAQAALGLGNKVAWRIICDGLTKAIAPELTIQQRYHLRRSAWEALKRLRRERDCCSS